MTLLSADFDRRRRGNINSTVKEYDAAVDILYKGGLVAINASGYAEPATDDVTDQRIVGVCEEIADNSGGSAGTIRVKVRSGATWRFAATSLTQSMVGAIMKVVDDNTIDNLSAGASVNEVQEVQIAATADGGTFKLAYKGEVTGTIAYNASAATVETAFEALTTVGAGNGTVTGSAPAWTITFTGTLAGSPNIEHVQIDATLLTNVPTAVDEVQELTIAAAADGGTFKLIFNGEESGTIAYNANAATIETAFEALSTVGGGNGTIAGSSPTFSITFTGSLAGAPQNLVVVNTDLLLDGAIQSDANVSRLTAGVSITDTETVSGTVVVVTAGGSGGANCGILEQFESSTVGWLFIPDGGIAA